MRRRLLRFFLFAIAMQILGAIIGQTIAKKLARGDETSDDFQVAAVMGGKQFNSTAGQLRHGSAIASLGGVEIDLREATLDPDGADLDLKATLGGVSVIVPDTWAVDVAEDVEAGEVNVEVTPPEKLPEDAPKLHIDARARMGGVQVMAKAS